MGLKAMQNGTSNGTSDPPTYSMKKLEVRSKSSSNIQLTSEVRKKSAPEGRRDATTIKLAHSKDNKSLASSTNKNLQDDKIFTTSKNDIKVD